MSKNKYKRGQFISLLYDSKLLEGVVLFGTRDFILVTLTKPFPTKKSDGEVGSKKKVFYRKIDKNEQSSKTES